MTLLQTEVNKIIDEGLTIISNTEVKGELKDERGESISGSAQTIDGTLIVILNNKIMINKKIEDIKERLKKEGQEYFDKTAKEIQNSFVDSIRDIFSFLGAMKLAGFYVLLLLPAFFRNTVVWIINKTRGIMNIIKPLMKKNKNRIKINATGRMDITYKGEPHILTVKMKKGYRTIHVTFDKKKYKLSISSRYEALFSALPLLGDIKAIFEKDMVLLK